MSAKTSDSMAENMADRIPEYVANRNPARMPDKVLEYIYICRKGMADRNSSKASECP